MISLRNGVTAFLRNKDKYLLMNRAVNRKIAPGVWSGVGGHVEPQELNDPLSACYREIEEESGIVKSQIETLDLQYIIIRTSKSEIRQNYIYFGETSQTDVTQTDEGVLFWVNENDLLDSVDTRLSQDISPKHDTTNLDGGNEGSRVLRISSGDSTPAFEV